MKHNVARLMETRKKDCTGCHACFAACPVGAVSMKRDEEGFLYPFVDEEKCIDCGRCLRCCQISNRKKAENRIPTEAFACMNRNTEERLGSSSGGIFIVLAEYVISRGGVVFGAAFDENMNLRHTYATDMEGCRAFMGSKYLQSTIGTAYADAKEFLSEGKTVLFTGTPCQIHGLKLFLGKEYENLIAVDLACHGVPSPAVFHKYISDLEKAHHSRVIGYSFRAKTKGWKNFSTSAKFQNGAECEKGKSECPYMRGFLENLYLRPTCYHCMNKGENRYSDLTLGDYWGVRDLNFVTDDDKGLSIVFTHTEKGKEILESVHERVTFEPANKDWAEQHNSAIVSSMNENPHREDFFTDFEKEKSASVSLEKMIRPYLRKKPVIVRIKEMIPQPIKRQIKRVLKIDGGGADSK